MIKSDRYRKELSDILRPFAPPKELHDVYTDDQRSRLLGVVRDHGPWKLIIAQHFASAEELLATMAGGAMPEGVTPTLDMFMTPTFRGFYVENSTVLYPEIADCFYNQKFLEISKSYWNAKYAKPQAMLFNINGPCGNTDPGHVDSPSFRGISYHNSPTWLCSIMGRSGLFRKHLVKIAQVLAWFSRDTSSGFTYWPNGPINAPERLIPPIYNRGVVAHNEMMVHRGEACGPLDQQSPAGLRFDTLFSGDPADKDGWILKSGDDVIAKHRTDELRVFIGWTAEVFEDMDELKKRMDGTDDLSHEMAINMLIDDVRSKGIRIETPSDPMHDPVFIGALNDAYNFGGPAMYPKDAPVSSVRA